VCRSFATGLVRSSLGGLATFGFTRWAMFRLVSWTRLSAAAAVLFLLPIGPHVPALVSLVVLAVLLTALNTVELLRVERIGWRALLERRAIRSPAPTTPRRRSRLDQEP
jgi:hypothetical protein